MLSPAERRTLAEIERQLAADHPAPARRGPATTSLAPRLLLAARILIAVLAVAGVVAGVAVARFDLAVVCAVTLAATEALLRRSS